MCTAKLASIRVPGTKIPLLKFLDDMTWQSCYNIPFSIRRSRMLLAPNTIQFSLLNWGFYDVIFLRSVLRKDKTEKEENTRDNANADC